MPETYDITYEGEIAGNAKMEKEGLYYHFSCLNGIILLLSWRFPKKQKKERGNDNEKRNSA